LIGQMHFCISCISRYFASFIFTGCLQLLEISWNFIDAPGKCNWHIKKL